MGKHPFLGRNWKLIVNIITVGVLLLLVFLIREQIVETFQNLGKVNWRYLLLIVPLVALSYHAQVRMYQRMFALIGHKLHYGFMTRVALELNFVNQVFPSGGVSGISYFGVRMRSADITATQASLVQIMKLLLLFVSFELLLIAGLLILALDGKANDLMLLVAGSITTLLAIGTVGFIAIIGSERRIHIAFTAITRFINKLVGFVTRHKGDAISTARAEGIVKDLHASYKTIESHWRDLRSSLGWALLVNLSAIAAIYCVYIAFGSWVNLGAIIVAYSVANFAGLISVLPGGAGIYEALMVGVLAAGGIPAALSLPVTVMWRVLTTLIQLPPGYVVYHNNVHRTGLTPLDQPHES
jgi:uncharacterized protein (TIRG00374 family)